MKVFHCDHCGALVFFENVTCMNCGHLLAFLPDIGAMGSLESKSDATWRSPLNPDGEYRLCANYLQHDVCNWALPADDPHALCVSCRLTAVIPDLGQPQQLGRWYKLETAKRRLIQSLMTLQLPITPKSEDEQRGLAFEFKSSGETKEEQVLTGHANGLITINVAEADDAEREKRRVQLHEPYRTVLGHMRHEIGHYYWDVLIADSDRLTSFRQRFGDEQQDYGAALQRHYNEGPPVDWEQRYVSAYCSSHPWEDWAETWAHYLHMTDTLDTAAACGVMLKPKRRDEPSLQSPSRQLDDFDRMLADWFPVTYMLNNLNRGLGLADAYPFVLSPPAIEKLRFVHATIHDHARAGPPST